MTQLTKAYIRQLIREELKQLNEAPPKMKANTDLSAKYKRVVDAIQDLDRLFNKIIQTMRHDTNINHSLVSNFYAKKIAPLTRQIPKLIKDLK